MLDKLAQCSLGQVLRHQAQENPEAPALLSVERCLNWAELDAEVDQLARLLHEVGVVAGDAVGFLLTKRPEVVTGFLACARLGAIVTPINFKLHPDHVRETLDAANVKTVLVEQAFDSLLHGMLSFFPDPARIVYVGGVGMYGDTDYGSVFEKPAGPVVAEPSPDSVVYYNFTSGTTGQPKGAITTHHNILQNALTAFDRDGVEGLGFTQDDVFLCMFSVFAHPHEIFHRSLLCGGAFVVLDTLSPRVVAQQIEQFSVRWVMAVPSFYEMLLDHANALKYSLESLRILEAGGAAVAPSTLERLETRFGASFMPVWGSTETTGVGLALLPTANRELGTTGKPLAGYRVRVVDSRGRDCDPGVIGEMWVQGEALSAGYVNNEEETRALFVDGWYQTRDLVRWTEHGSIEFMGRQSEMLKIGGIRVYPLEIEQVIAQHPAVRSVVVVRTQERVRGEIARAIVQLNTGAELDARRLAQYCRDRMAIYKVPRIIEFWDEIPLLPNGKIDKKAVLASGQRAAG